MPGQFRKLLAAGRSEGTSALPLAWLSAACMGARSPFYALERVIYDRKVRKQEVTEGPYFVIGHWRSGTTFLHNLLSVDDRFGYLDMSHMVTPNDMLLSRYLPVIPWLLKRNLPDTRGFDKIRLTPESPQEEEIALGILSGISYYNCYYFPDRFEFFFDKAILPGALDARETERFSRAYLQIVKKLTLVQGGKPILLKNPSSTARIRLLKGLFPRAKFVHIRRNPYAVFSSSLARLPRLIRAFRLRSGGELDGEGIVIRSYQKLMRAYLAQRDCLPPGDLVEVSYEDLVDDPERVVSGIYESLGLSPGEGQLVSVRSTVQRDGASAHNRHSLTPEQRERIEREWAFAFDEWDYRIPGGSTCIAESGAVAE